MQPDSGVVLSATRCKQCNTSHLTPTHDENSESLNRSDTSEFQNPGILNDAQELSSKQVRVNREAQEREKLREEPRVFGGFGLRGLPGKQAHRDLQDLQVSDRI